MTYSVSISGSSEGLEAEAATAREHDAIGKLRAVVGELEGVTGAHFSGNATGSTNLLEQADAPAEGA